MCAVTSLASTDVSVVAGLVCISFASNYSVSHAADDSAALAVTEIAVAMRDVDGVSAELQEEILSEGAELYGALGMMNEAREVCGHIVNPLRRDDAAEAVVQQLAWRGEAESAEAFARESVHYGDRMRAAVGLAYARAGDEAAAGEWFGGIEDPLLHGRCYLESAKQFSSMQRVASARTLIQHGVARFVAVGIEGHAMLLAEVSEAWLRIGRQEEAFQLVDMLVSGKHDEHELYDVAAFVPVLMHFGYADQSVRLWRTLRSNRTFRLHALEWTAAEARKRSDESAIGMFLEEARTADERDILLSTMSLLLGARGEVARSRSLALQVEDPVIRAQVLAELLENLEDSSAERVYELVVEGITTASEDAARDTGREYREASIGLELARAHASVGEIDKARSAIDVAILESRNGLSPLRADLFAISAVGLLLRLGRAGDALSISRDILNSRREGYIWPSDIVRKALYLFVEAEKADLAIELATELEWGRDRAVLLGEIAERQSERDNQSDAVSWIDKVPKQWQPFVHLGVARGAMTRLGCDWQTARRYLPEGAIAGFQ